MLVDVSPVAASCHEEASSRYVYMTDASAGAGRSCVQHVVHWLDRVFKVTSHGSSVRTELRAGCVSCLSMTYVLLVIPVLLSKADKNMEASWESLVTATALSGCIGTFLTGVFNRAPVAVIPGLRITAYFTFGMCHMLEISWGQAMSCCFVTGLLLLLFALLGLSNRVARWFPDYLKKSTTVAMGIFQAMVGFQMMGLEVSSHHGLENFRCRSDSVTFSNLQCSTNAFYLALISFGLISCLLVSKWSNGALLIGITVVTVGCWALGFVDSPGGLFALPRLETFLMLDFSGWLCDRHSLAKMITGTSVMLFVSLFDIIGVHHGLYGMGNMLKYDGNVPRSRGILVSAAVGTLAGAVCGTSPLIIANESSAAIMEGARTGLSAAMTSLLFGLSIFLSPVLRCIPDLAAAPPIIITAVFMMEPCRRISWDRLRVAIPSFVIITVVPYSFHMGFVAGLVLDQILGLVIRAKESERREHDPPSANWVDQSPKDLLVSMPHCASQHMELTTLEKFERAVQFLRDLGPPCTNKQRTETWEMALRQALSSYLDGMQAVIQEERPTQLPWSSRRRPLEPVWEEI